MKPVYVVSLGPGPADLMTVRARQALEASERVFTQGLDPDWFAGVLGPLLPAERLRHFAPEAKRWGVARRDPVYDVIADEIAALARAGSQVAVAAPGDAAFYSYFSYLEQPLAQRGVQWEYIPGVSFVAAASMATGISFVDVQDALVVKHIARIAELNALFRVGSVVVLYGVARLLYPRIREYALRHGIEYAQMVWLDPASARNCAADMLGELPAWRNGCSVILRRRHPATE